MHDRNEALIASVPRNSAPRACISLRDPGLIIAPFLIIALTIAKDRESDRWKLVAIF